jgi:mRNA-degrading endonuclease RelE of RelBE toxin-antitoxin system
MKRWSKGRRIRMYTIEKTNNFRFQYNKLPLRMKRFVDEAESLIQENPFDFQGKIKALAKKKDGRLFRFRMPGVHLVYIVHDNELVITMTQVKTMYKI